MRLWINTKKTNFRRVFSEIGNNLVPFQIGDIFENRPIENKRVKFAVFAAGVNTRGKLRKEFVDRLKG